MAACVFTLFSIAETWRIISGRAINHILGWESKDIGNPQLSPLPCRRSGESTVPLPTGSATNGLIKRFLPHFSNLSRDALVNGLQSLPGGLLDFSLPL